MPGPPSYDDDRYHSSHPDALCLGLPFTPGEAELAGVTRKTLRRLVREGMVRQLLQGVYLDTSVGGTLELRALAAATVVPPGSVVCDRTAAWVHGFDLRGELPRFRGARGVVQLRSLVPLADPRAESPAESISRLLLLDGGLSAPQVQWAVYNSFGVVIYRLDLAYPALMLAIEYDGVEHHSSDEDRAHDAGRRAYLRSLGWTFLILRSSDVYGRNPQAARRVGTVLSLLRAAAA